MPALHRKTETASTNRRRGAATTCLCLMRDSSGWGCWRSETAVCCLSVMGVHNLVGGPPWGGGGGGGGRGGGGVGNGWWGGGSQPGGHIKGLEGGGGEWCFTNFVSGGILGGGLGGGGWCFWNPFLLFGCVFFFWCVFVFFFFFSLFFTAARGKQAAVGAPGRLLDDGHLVPLLWGERARARDARRQRPVLRMTRSAAMAEPCGSEPRIRSSPRICACGGRFWRALLLMRGCFQ